MSEILMDVYKYIARCQTACLLQLFSAVSFLIALHMAAAHQGEVSPVVFILWLVGTGMLVTLSLAIMDNDEANQSLQRRIDAAGAAVSC